MNKEEQTTRIFTGSAIEAQPLLNALQEIGIHPIVKDDHQSGILSGFAAGVPGQIRVYIRKDEQEKVKDLLENFQ